MSNMTSVRITIAMLILAAAAAPALLLSWHQSAATPAAAAPGAAPAVKPVLPDGFKAVPWSGEGKNRLAQPAKADQPATPAPAPSGEPKPEPAPQPKPEFDTPVTDPAAVSINNPVIVELFTSEGCSSCPPAEKLVNELAADARNGQTYFLVFHVDYWDKLGWKDRFASSDFSSRQQAYAAALNEKGIYTPQMIVNGRVGFTGSNRGRAETAITAARLSRPAATLTATADKPAAGKPCTIRVRLTGVEGKTLPDDIRICCALVEDDLTTQVKTGENEGRALEHDRVVRAFAGARHDPATEAAITLAVPEDVNPAKCRLIAFAQDATTLHMLGAAIVE